MFQNIWENALVNTVIEEFKEISPKYVGVFLYYLQWDISALDSLLCAWFLNLEKSKALPLVFFFNCRNTGMVPIFRSCFQGWMRDIIC